MDFFQTLVVLGAMGFLTVLVARFCGAWSVSAFAALMFTIGFGFRGVAIQGDASYRVFNLFRPDMRDLMALDWVGLGGMICLCVGIFLAPARWRKRPEVVWPVLSRAEGKRYRTLWALCFLGSVGVVLSQAAILSLLYGGFRNAMEAYVQRSITNTTAVGFVGTLTVEAWSLSVPLALASAVCAFRSRERIFIWASVALIVALLPWLSALNGRAAAVITPWAAVMTVNRLTDRRIGAEWLVAGTPLAVVAAVAGLAWRTAAQQHIPFDVSLELSSAHMLEATSGALPMLDASYIGLEYVRVAGHNILNTLVAPFMVLIPRQFWPDKPIFAPQLFNEVVTHSGLSGLPAGLVGEGYVALGWVGVVGLCLTLGVAAAWADHAIRTRTMGDVVRGWFIFEAIVAATMGIRVGFQGALIAVQIALIWLPFLWSFQRTFMPPPSMPRAERGGTFTLRRDVRAVGRR
jgi:hypothetical protein